MLLERTLANVPKECFEQLSCEIIIRMGLDYFI